MPEERRTRIAGISQKAWRMLDKLTSSLAELSPPVALDGYARTLGVHSILFKPILSDAGLAKDDTGFQIIINADAVGEYPSGTRLSATDGTWAKLDPKLRFRIAHELAHIVFLAAAEQDKQSEVFVKNEKAVENACNILARIFLLPSRALVQEIGTELFNVEHIRSAISVFQVAPEVFIRRLNVSDMRQHFGEKRGILAFLKESITGQLIVKACHIWGSFAQQRFETALRKPDDKSRDAHMSLSEEFRQATWALEGKPINDMRLNRTVEIEKLIRTPKSGGQDIHVDWSSERILPCKLASCQLLGSPRSYLTSLEVTEPLLMRA
jgi:hypothetical protein